MSSIFLHTVYNKRGYRELVAQEAEYSMEAAIEEVKSLQHYETSGEVCNHIQLNKQNYIHACTTESINFFCFVVGHY